MKTLADVDREMLLECFESRVGLLWGSCPVSFNDRLVVANEKLVGPRNFLTTEALLIILLNLCFCAGLALPLNGADLYVPVLPERVLS